MTQPTNLSFQFYAGGGCKSANAKKTIEQKAHQKNRLNRTTEPEEGDDIIVSESVLRRVFNEYNIVQVLRCSCKICGEITKTVPPEDDKDMAKQIAADKGRLILLATLAFIGGTFAMRLLSRHAIHNVDQALDPERMSYPRESLFRRFTRNQDLPKCRHSPQHNDAVHCLDERFRECLRAKAWILRVPTFQANNLARQFSDRQNMPFINERLIQCRGASESRQFFQFEIHEEFCDEKLVGSLLFRKQLSTLNQHANVRAHIQEERDILVFLKDLHHPNICEVLFAYEEEHEKRYSLVFKFHSYDLEKILYPKAEDHGIFPESQENAVQFPGSKLESWIWKGFLGIIDAVAAVHDPQSIVTSIPKSNSHRLVGGHFDIKPANIIIDDNGIFLLTDFGQAYFKNVKIGEESNFTIVPGTYNYRPPPRYSRERAEQALDIETKKKWTRAYDIWSLACVSIEIIAFLIEGTGGPKKFLEERQNEDDEKFGKFWKTDSNNAPTLKDCVKNRLGQYKLLGDEYLNRVVKQIEDMFKIDELIPVTAKACLQSFSASVEVNRYMFKAVDEDLVGGTGTFKPFEKICSLYLWRNKRMDRIALTLEFPGTDGGTIIVPGSTSKNLDEFIPGGMFDVEALFQDNRPRSDLRYAFRNMHHGTTFHMSKKWDFYHIQGALTHQFTCDGSEVRIRSCSFTRPKMQLLEESRNFRCGHMQVWRYLTDKEYDALYCLPTAPAIVLPENYSLEDSSSSNTSIKKPKPKQQYRIVTLAIYLCGPDDRTLLVIPLNEDTYVPRFHKDGRELMTFERKMGASKFSAAIFDRPSPDTLPGIPLSGKVLQEKMNAGKGMKRLEVEFWNSDHREKFQKFYESIWAS